MSLVVKADLQYYLSVSEAIATKLLLHRFKSEVYLRDLKGHEWYDQMEAWNEAETLTTTQTVKLEGAKEAESYLCYYFGLPHLNLKLDDDGALLVQEWQDDGAGVKVQRQYATMEALSKYRAELIWQVKWIVMNVQVDGYHLEGYGDVITHVDGPGMPPIGAIPPGDEDPTRCDAPDYEPPDDPECPPETDPDNDDRYGTDPEIPEATHVVLVDVAGQDMYVAALAGVNASLTLVKSGTKAQKVAFSRATGLCYFLDVNGSSKTSIYTFDPLAADPASTITELVDLGYGNGTGHIDLIKRDSAAAKLCWHAGTTGNARLGYCDLDGTDVVVMTDALPKNSTSSFVAWANDDETHVYLFYVGALEFYYWNVVTDLTGGFITEDHSDGTVDPATGRFFGNGADRVVRYSEGFLAGPVKLYGTTGDSYTGGMAFDDIAGKVYMAHATNLYRAPAASNDFLTDAELVGTADSLTAIDHLTLVYQ